MPCPPAIIRLLSCVAENPEVSSRDLCEIMDLRPSSLSGMISQAEADGWIERTADTNDRRIQRVKITEKSTGITKTVGKKNLKTFPEGKKIYRAGPSAGKCIATARVVSGDDIYFLFRFSVALPDNGVDCYYYIVKWNFHTEECTFITTVEGFDSGCDHFLLFD